MMDAFIALGRYALLAAILGLGLGLLAVQRWWKW